MDTQSNHQRNYELMNPDQKRAFDAIYNNVMNPKPNSSNCFFINGPGGTGKTFIYQTLCQRLMEETENATSFVCVAFTGIAASLLPYGRTAHSAFKFKINKSYTCPHKCPANKIRKCPQKVVQRRDDLKESDRELLCDAKLIIWDEISMVPKWMLKEVDDLFREITMNPYWFGGKTFVVGGDFRQLLPVITKGHKSKVFTKLVKNFAGWSSFQKFTLTINQRTDDTIFRNYLMQLGDGKIGTFICNCKKYKKQSTCQCDGQKKVPIQPRYLSPYHHLEDVPKFVNSIYNKAILRDPNHLTLSPDVLYQMSTAVILASTNVQVNKLNNDILRQMTTEQRTFKSKDSLHSSNPKLIHLYNKTRLNNKSISGVPPHELNLKLGCIVILMRNLSVENGLTNGTRLRLIGFGDNELQCTILTNNGHVGDIISIGERNFDVSVEQSGLRVSFSRVQYPVCLAFAITIHRSQGQTFDKVGIYLENPVFTHGQLYVAMSRGRNADQLKVFILSNSDDDKVRNRTLNIVWPEILIDKPKQADTTTTTSSKRIKLNNDSKEQQHQQPSTDLEHLDSSFDDLLNDDLNELYNEFLYEHQEEEDDQLDGPH